MTFFPGFQDVDVDVAGVRIHARVGRDGPPVLLLHGYPQTHVMWHAVAPVLAREHTVVVADLRGYGDSAAPAPSPDAREYTKKAMAADQLGLMAALGHRRFAAVGHDRGARVVHRMCLDAPHAVSRAAVVDVVPTAYVFGHADRGLGMAYYHWFFLAQPGGLPERMIGADPEWYLRHHLAKWSGGASAFADDAVAEYLRWFARPASIAASCADYRAAATLDLDDDDADAGGRLTCPLLVLWGARGFVGSAYDVLGVWQQYAEDVRGAPLDAGHFVPEERPDETAAALAGFLGVS